MKLILTSLVVLFFGLQAAIAQQDTLITATVTQIAGQNVYLNIGSEDGVASGDTLYNENAPDQLLQVVSASRNQSVTEFAGPPFPITRGDHLLLRFFKRTSQFESPIADVETTQASDTSRVSSIMKPAEESLGRAPERRSDKVRVEGRLILSSSFLQSETAIRSSNVPAVKRSFITPSANLNLSISNLPSDFRLNVHLRTDYRYQSSGALGQQNSFRAYRLNLEKNLPFGQVQAGRFYHRFTQRGGYWDGISFLLGSKKKGVGASVGFMPDRANEGFTTQFPRYSVFAHYETPRKSRLRYSTSASYNEIQPASTFLAHRFLGLEQRVNFDILSLSQDLQVDQDPISKNWVVSHFQLNSLIAIGKHVSLRGRYALRQPYRIYSIDRPFLVRRDHYTGGLNLQFEKVSVGASYTMRMLNHDYEGQTVSGYFNTRPLTRFNLSFSGSVSRWESEFSNALYANGSLSKQFGRVITRAGYGFYQTRSPNLNTTTDMHRVFFSTSVPFSRRLYWNLRANYSQSEFLKSFSLDTSLQIRF